MVRIAKWKYGRGHAITNGIEKAKSGNPKFQLACHIMHEYDDRTLTIIENGDVSQVTCHDCRRELEENGVSDNQE